MMYGNFCDKQGHVTKPKPTTNRWDMMSEDTKWPMVTRNNAGHRSTRRLFFSTVQLDNSVQFSPFIFHVV